MKADPSLADTSRFQIDSDWLERVKGLRFLYPSSGSDIEEPVRVFADYVSRMTFCDICNGYGFKESSLLKSLVRNPSRDYGDPFSRMTYRTIPQRHRWIEPSRVEFDLTTRRGTIELSFRRGFGQYALLEEPDGMLGIFMHRGDSPGEGGSNVRFLGNTQKAHEPLSNLMQKLAKKLAKNAIIVSDGSNSHVSFVRKFYDKPISSEEAFEYFRGREFYRLGYAWRVIGFLSRRYGPTLVWGVNQI